MANLYTSTSITAIVNQTFSPTIACILLGVTKTSAYHAGPTKRLVKLQRSQGTPSFPNRRTEPQPWRGCKLVRDSYMWHGSRLLWDGDNMTFFSQRLRHVFPTSRISSTRASCLLHSGTLCIQTTNRLLRGKSVCRSFQQGCDRISSRSNAVFCSSELAMCEEPLCAS
jgi:hypothetical protein